jgi:ligand-binding sensor domain-containing protein
VPGRGPRAADPDRRTSEPLGRRREAAVAVHASQQYQHEGIPQDSVHSITQTPDGYLWIATQEGIARFDGAQFTVFDSRTTNGVVPNLTFTLFVDRGGTLWAGGGDGILRYGGNGTWIKHDSRQGSQRGALDRYLSRTPCAVACRTL